MNILITASFSKREIDRLKKDYEVHQAGWGLTGNVLKTSELINILIEKKIDILIVELEEVNRRTFEKCSNLKIVGCCRGNPVNVDIEAATEHKIPVINTPGRNAIAVAEMTVAFLVNIARNIPKSFVNLKNGKWEINNHRPYLHYRGIEINQSTIGLIGFGIIGKEVTKRLKCFNANILIYDPFASNEEISSYGAKGVSLASLLKESRFVSIHCAVTPETKGMIGAKEFKLMRNDAFLINTARAVITDKKALYDALENNVIAGAALDVFHEEPLPADDLLTKYDNVIITPHIGGATKEVINHHSEIVIQGIMDLLKGETTENLFNPNSLSS